MARTRRRKSPVSLHRLKVPLACCAGIGLLMVGISFCSGLFTPEALTPEQIMTKEAWSEAELTDTLARQVALTGNARGNTDVMKHLQKKIATFDNGTRSRIREQALNQSIRYAQEQYASMPPDMRKDIVNKMVNRCQQLQKRLNEMNPEEREKLRKKVNDPAFAKEHRKATDDALDKLSPDHRKELAPLVKEWANALESI